MGPSTRLFTLTVVGLQPFSLLKTIARSGKMASASAVLKEIGQDFLECGICFERYTNPKILSCVHSFCEKCLVQYYGNDVVKTCPVCRQETRLPVPGGISGLKTNGFILTLREKVELQEKVAKLSDKARRTCELCTENEVTHHCLNCSQNICQGCMNIHKRSKVSADHTVGTLEDIREGKVTLPEEQKEYTCNTHKGGQSGIASFGNALMVADMNGCVQIYNEDFTTTSQLHPTLDGKIDKKSRIRGDPTFELLDILDQHTCICVKKDGTILVGHSKENVITLIHRPTGKPIHTTRISLPKSPWFLATDCNDRVVVSGRDDNQVIVIDDQGATLVTIKPTTNGHPVNYCSGVCCDGSDIYVAVDNYGPVSGHIHRYDSDGKFISCIIQGLRFPRGITFTEDGRHHLAVADVNDVKIYQKLTTFCYTMCNNNNNKRH